MLYPPGSGTVGVPIASLIERLGRRERWPAHRLHASRFAGLRALPVHALTHWPHALRLRRAESIGPPGFHKLAEFVSLVDPVA